MAQLTLIFRFDFRYSHNTLTPSMSLLTCGNAVNKRTDKRDVYNFPLIEFVELYKRVKGRMANNSLIFKILLANGIYSFIYENCGKVVVTSSVVNALPRLSCLADLGQFTRRGATCRTSFQ